MTEAHSERYRKEKRRFEAIVSEIPHKKVPVFRGPGDKWLAAEENVLLMAIQGYGYGNWNLLATILTEKFNKKFTPEEVCDHYNNTYLEGEIAEAMRLAYARIYRSSRVDHTCTEDDELSKSADVYSYENIPHERLKEIGYMPLREQFTVEYGDESEELVSNLSCKYGDEYDKNLVLIVLDAYLLITEQREKLKKVITKRKFVEQYFSSCDHKKDENCSDSNSLNEKNDEKISIEDMLFDSNDYVFERQTRSKSKSLGNREIIHHEIASRRSWHANIVKNNLKKSHQVHLLKKRQLTEKGLKDFERKAIEGQKALTIKIEQMSKDVETIKNSICEKSKNTKKVIDLLTNLNSNLKKTNEKLDILTEMFSEFVKDKKK